MSQKQDVHLFLGSGSTLSRRSAGFTMVEILVTLGIMLLLFGIVAGASVRITGEVRRNQARAVMVALLGANEEFKAKSMLGSINHDGAAPVNWANFAGADTSSERFVAGMKRIPVCEEAMINALKSSSEAAFNRQYKDVDNDGYFEIYDRWGTEIQYRDSNPSPPTGTFSGVANNLLPVSPFPFFVSAGPDKEFGTDDDITTLD